MKINIIKNTTAKLVQLICLNPLFNHENMITKLPLSLNRRDSTNHMETMQEQTYQRHNKTH